MERNDTIKRIKRALKRRSGREWSVTGGRGTAWGWIRIEAPPRRRTWRQVPAGQTDEHGHDVYNWVNEPDYRFGSMGPSDCEQLGKLLGLDKPTHPQGESIPSGGDYWQEYVDRAEGRTPSVVGKQYWD